MKFAIESRGKTTKMKFRSISIHALRTAHINKLLNGNEMTMGWMELGARFLSIFMSG
jgi:hypothetical protein